ncbi:MAG: hypothetical protein ACKOPH_00360 [Methylocystis sp.]
MNKKSCAALLAFFAIVLPNLVTAQNYDEKFEITDPTFEERSKQERALENRRSVEPLPNTMPSNRKKNKTLKIEDSQNLFDF